MATSSTTITTTDTRPKVGLISKPTYSIGGPLSSHPPNSPSPQPSPGVEDILSFPRIYIGSRSSREAARVNSLPPSEPITIPEPIPIPTVKDEVDIKEIDHEIRRESINFITLKEAVEIVRGNSIDNAERLQKVEGVDGRKERIVDGVKGKQRGKIKKKEKGKKEGSDSSLESSKTSTPPISKSLTSPTSPSPSQPPLSAIQTAPTSSSTPTTDLTSKTSTSISKTQKKSKKEPGSSRIFFWRRGGSGKVKS